MPDPTFNPRLKHILEGARRLNVPQPDQRLPVTAALLSRLPKRLHLATPNLHDQQMFWAAFTISHHFLLRVSELTSPSPTSFDPATTLLLQDVHWSTYTLEITLKQSKTDQRRKGIKLSLTPSEAPATFAACLAYTKRRQLQRPPNLPFFVHDSGRYLTRNDLSNALKISLPPEEDRDRYSSHCFRIGGATSAAASGASAEAICARGRWKSSSFLRYIRPCPTRTFLFGAPPHSRSSLAQWYAQNRTGSSRIRIILAMNQDSTPWPRIREHTWPRIRC
ncbi:uncharacterized protein LOC129589569 [Paramacrobiotus metropolitanus]|uniref:uncharacterized protein LOC129585424 n=1 Tax=Paramacrobiotus metropolitanus TaxID=2943436 RepID=UPI002445981D|nr:uncharacterized protein LOC129585424 [Paramacrobiotus metropolitanus]XP_055340344.1 uncharacterized protein LOC129589569 [Paramacrobiotus metropolitanus]